MSTITTSQPLADDLLRDVKEIAAYLGESERRTRHLIDKGVIPSKKVLGRIQSRRSWIDGVYAEPDQPVAGNGGGQ
jgi:hypothetical protein